MSIWRDMTDPPEVEHCPVCNGAVDYDAIGLSKYREMVAELKELKNRTCDGCRHDNDERVCPSVPCLPRGLAPHESCSRWESKP
jgi:hypothetical protein